MSTCCSNAASGEKEFEIVKIQKTKNVCPMCEDFAAEQIKKKTPIAILSCEGACLRGEVARQAANLITFKMLPEKTARICLGGAFTKDTGQRDLVRKSEKVIALEGCFIECGSRMMKGVIEGFNPEVIIVDRLYDFDKKLFAINDVPEEKIKEYASVAASKILKTINKSTDMISIQKLKQTDFETLNQLLQDNDLPIVDTNDQTDHFFKAVDGSGRMIGAIGLEIYEQFGLLRSLVVDKNYRSNGIAKLLVNEIQDLSGKLKLLQLILLTTTADKYFEKHGFKRILRNETPEEVKHSKEFSSICPVSAVIMQKMIN